MNARTCRTDDARVARGDVLDAFVGLVADAVAERLPAASVPSIMPEDEWRLLDVDEAASRLGRSSRWVRERVKRGDLPYVRLDGGAFAFELDDLREFARSRRVPLAGRLQAVPDTASRKGLRSPDQVADRRVGS
jgi:excisionase family DNA binding protein